MSTNGDAAVGSVKVGLTCSSDMRSSLPLQAVRNKREVSRGPERIQSYMHPRRSIPSISLVSRPSASWTGNQPRILDHVVAYQGLVDLDTGLPQYNTSCVFGHVTHHRLDMSDALRQRNETSLHGLLLLTRFCARGSTGYVPSDSWIPRYRNRQHHLATRNKDSVIFCLESLTPSPHATLPW